MTAYENKRDVNNARRLDSENEIPTSCTYATDRLKYHTEDYNQILASYWQPSSAPFIEYEQWYEDVTFAWPYSIYWDNFASVDHDFTTTVFGADNAADGQIKKRINSWSKISEKWAND